MTITPSLSRDADYEVLLALGQPAFGSCWFSDFEDAFSPSGFAVVRALSGPEPARLVERGGLAAAILITDRRRIDGLSLLRVIRSIDRVLPCWLVDENPTRQTLEAALSLKVTSVITQPVGANELALALRKVLIDPIRGS